MLEPRATAARRDENRFATRSRRRFAIRLGVAAVAGPALWRMMPVARSNESQIEVRLSAAAGVLSCVLLNHTHREVAAWQGYDGKENQLRHEGRFPISLYSRPALPATRITLTPGMSATLFTFSLDEIFFLDPTQPRVWRWGWAPGSPAPRGAPPVSPIHGQGGLGWQFRRAQSATVVAEIEAGGARIKSPPLELRFEQPQFEEIKALVRFDSARVVPPDKDARFYEIRFTVVKAMRGVITPEERTMTLPADNAEWLMREAGSRLDSSGNNYRFASKALTLTFARVKTAGGGAALILAGYTKP